MSYIRCLSNPEALYVHSDGRRVTIDHNVKPPHSSGKNFTIPSAVFRAGIKKYMKFEDGFSHRGMKVEEVHVDKRTGMLIPDLKPCPKCTDVTKNGFAPCRPCLRSHWRDAKHGWFAIRLSYGKHFVNLWRVTWAYTAKRGKQ